MIVAPPRLVVAWREAPAPEWADSEMDPLAKIDAIQDSWTRGLGAAGIEFTVLGRAHVGPEQRERRREILRAASHLVVVSGEVDEPVEGHLSLDMFQVSHMVASTEEDVRLSLQRPPTSIHNLGHFMPDILGRADRGAGHTVLKPQGQLEQLQGVLLGG